jgi:hypothetical protein
MEKVYCKKFRFNVNPWIFFLLTFLLGFLLPTPLISLLAVTFSVIGVTLAVIFTAITLTSAIRNYRINIKEKKAREEIQRRRLQNPILEAEQTEENKKSNNPKHGTNHYPARTVCPRTPLWLEPVIPFYLLALFAIATSLSVRFTVQFILALLVMTGVETVYSLLRQE